MSPKIQRFPNVCTSVLFVAVVLPLARKSPRNKITVKRRIDREPSKLLMSIYNQSKQVCSVPVKTFSTSEDTDLEGEAPESKAFVFMKALALKYAKDELDDMSLYSARDAELERSGFKKQKVKAAMKRPAHVVYCAWPRLEFQSWSLS